MASIFTILILTSLIPDGIAQRVEFSTFGSDLSVKYSIVASKVVRPSTIFHVVASLASDSSDCRVMASIARNGVAVTNNEIQLFASQSHGILLKVPPDNSGDNKGREKELVKKSSFYAENVAEYQNPNKAKKKQI